MQTQKIADIFKGTLFFLAGLLLLLNILGFVEKFATILLLLLATWLILQGLYLSGLLNLLRDYWKSSH